VKSLSEGQGSIDTVCADVPVIAVERIVSLCSVKEFCMWRGYYENSPCIKCNGLDTECHDYDKSSVKVKVRVYTGPE
jgi:hypothetical protein